MLDTKCSADVAGGGGMLNGAMLSMSAKGQAGRYVDYEGCAGEKRVIKSWRGAADSRAAGVEAGDGERARALQEAPLRSIGCRAGSVVSSRDPLRFTQSTA